MRSLLESNDPEDGCVPGGAEALFGQDWRSTGDPLHVQGAMDRQLKEASGRQVLEVPEERDRYQQPEHV